MRVYASAGAATSLISAASRGSNFALTNRTDQLFMAVYRTASNPAFLSSLAEQIVEQADLNFSGALAAALPTPSETQTGETAADPVNGPDFDVSLNRFSGI